MPIIEAVDCSSIQKPAGFQLVPNLRATATGASQLARCIGDVNFGICKSVCAFTVWKTMSALVLHLHALMYAIRVTLGALGHFSAQLMLN
jgi:hypothetical protein